MNDKVSMEDGGKRISGLYFVKDGIVTVTASNGSATRGVIEESMLSARPSQGRFCFSCTGIRRRPDR